MYEVHARSELISYNKGNLISVTVITVPN